MPPFRVSLLVTAVGLCCLPVTMPLGVKGAGNFNSVLSWDGRILFTPTADSEAGCPLMAALDEAGVLGDLAKFNGAGDCPTVGRCVNSACLNRLPLPCHMPHLGDDFSSTNPRRTAYSSLPQKKVVITMGYGPDYGPDWATAFLGSLRRSGYDGLIVLFVNVQWSPSPLLAALLHVLDVEVSRVNFEEYRRVPGGSVRFIAYEAFLSQQAHRLSGARVFTCDARDLFFQADPLEGLWPKTEPGYYAYEFLKSTFVPLPQRAPDVPAWPSNTDLPAELVIVLEGSRKSMFNCSINRGMVSSCVNDVAAGDMARDHVALTNSGSTFGTYMGQLLYLREMSSWFLDSSRLFTVGGRSRPLNANNCPDQGLLLYLTYNGGLDAVFARAYAQGKVKGGVGYFHDEDGPVRTVGYGETTVCGGPSRDDAVVNQKGQRATVVHQHDRRCFAVLGNTWLLGSEDETVIAKRKFKAAYPPFRGYHNPQVIDCPPQPKNS